MIQKNYRYIILIAVVVIAGRACNLLIVSRKNYKSGKWRC